MPCLVWAGMMLGALPPVFLRELTYDPVDDEPATQTRGKLMFLAGYGSFLVVPALVIVRMWNRAFDRSISGVDSCAAVDSEPELDEEHTESKISGSRPRAGSRAATSLRRRTATAGAAASE